MALGVNYSDPIMLSRKSIYWVMQQLVSCRHLHVDIGCTNKKRKFKSKSVKYFSTFTYVNLGLVPWCLYPTLDICF